VCNEVPVVTDRLATFWGIVQTRGGGTPSRQGGLDRQLTPGQRLSVGWVKRYAVAVNALEHELRLFAERHQAKLVSASEFVDSRDPLVVALRSPAPSVDGLLNSLSQMSTGVSWFQDVALVLQDQADRISKVTNDDLPSSIAASAIEVLLGHGARTKGGQLLPWVDLRSGELKRLPLEPDHFPEEYDPADYWDSLDNLLLPHWGALLSGRDVPLEIHSDKRKAWSDSFPVVEDALQTDVTINALLDEAIRDKQWAVPPRALVELPIGPFSTMELTEHEGCYYAVLRTSDGRTGLFICEPDKHYFSFSGLCNHEWDDRVWAAVRVLGAAVIRDFSVVENREAVFRAHRTRAGYRVPRAPDNPVIVYLPRVHYKAPPNVDKCASEFEHSARAAHQVSAHIRRAETASPGQQILAQRYGFSLPQGYTFVRPHERGTVQRQVIYRSRSALRTLFEGKEASQNSNQVEWFQFERDVREAIAALGFSVEHVSAARSGDEGVDLYATKGNDFDAVNWIIQCKCYAPTRKVGPAVVRELLGALESYPRGTRGMIVTTSDFSSDARRLAQDKDVRLVNGPEFLKLSKLRH